MDSSPDEGLLRGFIFLHLSITSFAAHVSTNLYHLLKQNNKNLRVSK